MEEHVGFIDEDIAGLDAALVSAKARVYDATEMVRALTEQRFRLNETRKRILAEQAKQQQKPKEGGGDGAVGDQPHQG